MNANDVNPDRDAIVKDIIDDLPRLVAFRDAAERMSVSESTLRRWVSQGKLVVVKTAEGASGRCFVPRVELGRLLRARLLVG